MNSKPDYNELYIIAENQAGYFTAAQARGVGFSWERLTSSVKSGKFQRVAAGVYRLTQFPHHPNEDLYFTWLSAGLGSAISHESALAFYGLSDVLPSEIHIIIPQTASRRRKNVRLHTNRLSPDEVTTRDGLRLTTVTRTIADVAASGTAEEIVRQAIREAIQRGMVSEIELTEQADRRGGRSKKIIMDELRRINPE